MISNCSKDERKGFSGGRAGDQTGEEYRVCPWYNRPWSCVLRYKGKENVGKVLANVARNAANNKHIGYNQAKRHTYYLELKKVHWHPEKITTNCDSDCSASTCTNVVAVGHLLEIEKLKNLNPLLTTSTMKAELVKRGFQVLTGSQYTKQAEHLLPGDILLYEGHHAAINLDKGSKV